MNRLLRYLVMALLAAGLGFWVSLWFRDATSTQPQAGTVSVPGGVQIGGPFTLVGADGQTVRDSDFRGKVMLIYFGYTFCPDVCPTELQAVAASLEQLGPDAARVQPIFITIDPERDTPKAMGEYVKLFDDRIIGLTGSVEQIAAVAKAFRAYYAKSESKTASTYLMDHSSFLYVVGADGGFRAVIKAGAQPGEIAQIVKAQLPKR